MSLVLGIDPGSSGAFAVYDTETRRIVGDILRMPVWQQVVGKRKRKRIDSLALAEMMDTYNLMGIDLVVIEAVGGRPGQNAMNAFTFGYGVGQLNMACIYSKIPMDTIEPATWKQVLRVPGKSRADDTAILARAEEIFPDDRHQFRGPKGGKMIDKAEAAMIAKFGGDYILQEADTLQSVKDKLHRSRNAQTGA